MIVLFLVVANTAFVCYGARFCEAFDPVILTRLWTAGAIELMFEAAGVLKVYRRVKDKLPPEDREDKEL